MTAPDREVTLAREPGADLGLVVELRDDQGAQAQERPLSDDDPDIAPDLVPLRKKLMAMVKRPVNIQASREIVLQFRGGLLDQPYLTLFEKPDQPPVVERPRA